MNPYQIYNKIHENLAEEKPNDIKDIKNKLETIENKISLIMEKLNIKEKKPIDYIQLYGLKPLSFYDQNKN
jgi:hypothetical protein